MARQDIAVGGYYQAIVAATGKYKGQYVVQAHVFVLDIGKKKVVSEFDTVMPADASLFTAVEELAARVVVEAKSVLPNKGESVISRDDNEETGPHEVGLIVGTGFAAVPGRFRTYYTGEAPLYTKDFAAPISVAAFYSYHDFWRPRFQLNIMGGALFGSQKLDVATDTKTINASLTDIFIAAHLGYDFYFWRLNLTPFLGGGFSLASVTLDYTSLSGLPTDSSGNTRSASRLNISAPFAQGGVVVAIKLTGRLSLRIYGLYRQSFYLGHLPGEAFCLAGFGYRL